MNGKIFSGQGTLENQGYYFFGSFKEWNYHGPGTMFFSWGDKFEGTWFENKYHGIGIYSEKNGNKYQGEYVENHLHKGVGMMIQNNCVIFYFTNHTVFKQKCERFSFEGSFSYNKETYSWIPKSGEYTYSNSSKSYLYLDQVDSTIINLKLPIGIISGTFTKDIFDSDVTLTLSDGQTFRGFYDQGFALSGKGILFLGKFKYLRTDNNSLTFADYLLAFSEADYYIGSISEFSPSGNGTLFMHNGDSCRGFFSNLTGDVSCLFQNGDKFQGKWSYPHGMNGPGVYTLKTGESHKGIYKEGKGKSGVGVKVKKDGTFCYGMFEKGEFEGYALCREGKDLIGNYRKGKIVSGESNKNFYNRYTYIGSFQGGKRHGYGVIRRDGVEMSGIWKEGKPWSGGCMDRIDFKVYYEGEWE